MEELENVIKQDEIIEIFSSNLKSYRRKYNLTQQQLAAYLKITRARVGAWEEARALPPFEFLLKLSKIFDTNIESLATIEAPFK